MTRRFGVNTYAYSQSASAADCVRRLAALGFTEFELMIMPGHLWPTDGEGALQGLRNALEGHTLSTLNTANLDINVAAAAEEMRDYSTTLLRRFIWLAGSLGARFTRPSRRSAARSGPEPRRPARRRGRRRPRRPHGVGRHG